MLSQKLQKDLMNAYAAVHEEKRGHASGDSDVEKQASQLASDVRYKAKGKVKPGTSDEEKKKVFLQILGASPAPSSVKAMARQKLLGEEVVLEDKKMAKQSDDDLSAAHKKFSGMDQSTPSNKFMLKRIEKEMKKRKTVKEGSAYGMTKGDGMSFPERLKMKAKEKKKKISEDTKAMKAFLNKKAKKLESAKKKQKPEYANNPAFGDPSHHSNAKNRTEEVVSEMGGMKMKQVVKSKPVKNEKDMSKEPGQKAPVDYRTLSQSHEPVGNIFNEKKMDPVGQEDGDINNDGKKDGTDKYLANRRKAIGKMIAKKRGKVKEGFSAWRIDLDFNEQVKK